MTSAAAIMQVIRGDALWPSLNESEVIVRRDGEQWVFPTPVSTVVMPTEEDIAEGLAHFAKMPGELRDWASFVLAASSLIDLGRIGASPFGTELLDALWDISSGEPIDSELFDWLEKHFRPH